MNLKKIKVYHLFWIVAVLIIMIGIVQNNNPKVFFDINIHDTYYVMSNFDSTIFISVCFFLMGAGYWIVQKLFKKKLVRFLTLVHSIILMGSFLLYWIIFFFNRRTQIDPNFPLLYDFQSVNIVLVSELLLIVFVATPIYIINLLIGIFRKSKTE